MKLAITSDTHLGDPLCSLVEWNGNDYTEGPKYKEFKEAAGTGNDYLILLGDILDFSVTSYENAYRAGKVFFTLVQKDKIADQIIYVPGNHDYDIWNIVENEVNIIHQIKNGKIPRKFRTAVPGILDDRTNTDNPGLTLSGVGKRSDGSYTYGGLFLDHITDDPSHFIFCYPNLYLATDEGTILMTHGHYLDNYWSLLSKWAPIIFGSDLKLGTKMDIQEMVGMNFPFNQLACSGVGQAGILSEILSKVQQQIKEGKIEKTRQYLDNLDKYLDDNVFDYRKWYQFINEAASDLASNKAKKLILDKISSVTKVRYNKEYFQQPEVQERFFTYYNACLAELEELGKLNNINIQEPDKVIFGHTHEAISLERPIQLPLEGKRINLFNTGGWLHMHRLKEVYAGAEVFKYENGLGIRAPSLTRSH